jgi:ubiquinone/menaquinone biosynthesis C-methylase UbiE
MNADIKTHPVVNSSSKGFTKYQNIAEYYNVAGPDYEAWSKNFNMHFGYCKKFTDIFNLEKMLVRMNDEVIDRLKIPAGGLHQVIDLGCGVGTVARHTAKKIAGTVVTGITISPYQIKKGKELTNKEKLIDRVFIVKDNFESLHYANDTFDYAYALESACHAQGSSKEKIIKEMARVLKTGGCFCIADGFIKHNNKLPWLFRKLNKKITDCWALPCFGNIHHFTTALKANGLKNIEVKEISMNIAPSVAYVPWVCLKFFAKEIWRNKGSV